MWPVAGASFSSFQRPPLPPAAQLGERSVSQPPLRGSLAAPVPMATAEGAQQRSSHERVSLFLQAGCSRWGLSGGSQPRPSLAPTMLGR